MPGRERPSPGRRAARGRGAGPARRKGLVRLHAGVARAERYWSEPPGGAAGGLLYVALGDSTAKGVGASRPDRGYVGLLAQRMRTASGGPVRVVNLSVSGARIDDVLRRQLPALRGLRPDVVTVGIGGNDLRAYDAGTFRRRVDLLTAALPAGTYVADAPSFMHGHWERDARQAAGVLSTSADAHGLPVVALHEALRSQGWSAMLTQFAADWFHPSDRGYRVWADAFWTRLGPRFPPAAVSR